MEHDLVLRNGRVVNGTGNPWFHAEVADAAVVYAVEVRQE